MKDIFLILVDDEEAESKRLEITEENFEWILNSLRLMQEHQQKLAGDYQGHVITRPDVLHSLGMEADDKDLPPVPIDDLFLEQHDDITKFREQLVEFVGYDMTDS